MGKRGLDVKVFYKIVFVFALLFAVYSLITDNGFRNKILFAPGDELLNNRGFETALDSTTDWWKNSGTSVSIDTLQKHSGLKSLKISSYGYVLQRPNGLKGSDGKRFMLTLWAKNSSALKIGNKVGIQGSTSWILPNERSINFAGISDEWKQFSVTFTLSSTDADTDYHVTLGTESTNLGTIWFDDVSLVELPPIIPLGDELLNNRGFETALDSTTDWWKTSGTSVSLDTLQKYSGLKSLKISGSGYVLQRPNGLKGADGKRFILTLWAKNSSALKIGNRVGIQGSTSWILPGERSINFAGISDQWKQFSVTFTLSSTDADTDYHVVLGTEATNLGTIWFDDVSLVEVSIATPPVSSCNWPINTDERLTANNTFLIYSGTTLDKKALCYNGIWYVTNSTYDLDGTGTKIILKAEGETLPGSSWKVIGGLWTSTIITPPVSSCNWAPGTSDRLTANNTFLIYSGTTPDKKALCYNGIWYVTASSYDLDGPGTEIILKAELEEMGTWKVVNGFWVVKTQISSPTLKQVNLTNVVVEQHICDGYINVKCVMNDTFDDLTKQGVEGVWNISTNLYTNPENSVSAPATYVYRILVDKTLSGKYYIGCKQVIKIPSDIIFNKTLKQDYVISPCSNINTQYCYLTIRKSNGEFELRNYSIGDRRIIESGAAYCADGGNWRAQKGKDANCDGDYECLSDNCDSDGECTNPGTIVNCTGGVSVGARVGNNYCATNGSLINLKSTGANCLYYYECSSNSCISGICSSGGSTGAVCGNQIIETGEGCEGSNLNSQTCVSQGFSGGTLSCISCFLDNSQCTRVNQPECSIDDDCSSGEACSASGTCVSQTECSSDSDCADGEVCDAGSCVSGGNAIFWVIFLVLLVLSIIVLIVIWFVYKNKKIGSEPGRNIKITPRFSPAIPPSGNPVGYNRY
ncbi:MAG: carbohydrate binding domain-containing protein [Candidatus Pacearchaeota archaeon]